MDELRNKKRSLGADRGCGVGWGGVCVGANAGWRLS